MASFDAGSPTIKPSMLQNVWQLVPEGHEKHLKQAFYNTLASVFLVFAAAGGVGVYFILDPFLRPLSWALLCGTFLYPVKWMLTNALRSWLTGLQKSGTPFAVGCALLPLQIGNNVAHTMTEKIWEYKNALIALTIGLPTVYFSYHFASTIAMYKIITSILIWLNGFVDYFDSYWVLALFVGYMSCVVFLWTPTSTWLGYMSAPVWLAVFLYFANLAGPLRVPLFLLLVVIVFVGIVKEIMPIDDELSESSSSGTSDEDLVVDSDTKLAEEGPTVSGPAIQTEESIPSGSAGVDPPTTPGLTKQGQSKSVTSSVGTENATSLSPLDASHKPASKLQPGASQSSPSILEKPSQLHISRSMRHQHLTVKESSAAMALRQLKKSQVNTYFIMLAVGHFIVRVWMHTWIIVLLLLFPLLHYCGRIFLRQFKEGGIFHERAQGAKTSVLTWVENRKGVIMPRCLKGLGAFLMKGDQQMISLLEKGLDQATSIVFILALLFGTAIGVVIGAVQIQRETVYIASATQKMLNNTMNSEYSEWMPKADEVKLTMDRVLKNSHQQGRNLIASRVTDFIPQDSSKEERENLINQVLEIWDKLYDTVSASLAETPSGDNDPQIWGQNNKGDEPLKSLDPSDLYDSLGSSVSHVSNMLHMSAAVEFVKQNLGMFMSVMESVFQVMKSNMNLILTVITFVFSAILGGGTAILNFVISFIIFLTTLGYLLSSSGDVYKPVEIFSSIPGSTGSRFGKAVEQSISSVFTASLKMAAFYGLHTWLIHLIFGMEIVFIPSTLAAVFAAVPFVGAYWAALPAVIELWLVEGRGLAALALFVAHMLPSYVVDTRIYSEIEGGHPYVTGLAIAGGIMWMGLEGAIIGPIILCCLIVVFKMYGSFLTPDPAIPDTPQRPWRISHALYFKKASSTNREAINTEHPGTSERVNTIAAFF